MYPIFRTHSSCSLVEEACQNGRARVDSLNTEGYNLPALSPAHPAIAQLQPRSTSYTAHLAFTTFVLFFRPCIPW